MAKSTGSVINLFLRALVILVASSSIGIALNVASSRPLPWIYEVAKELDLQGVKVPLVDEKQARQFFGNAETVFVDTREEDDYAKGHVKGAVLFPSYEKEDRFAVVQPLLPKEARLILYCYGPQCEMAEELARFLAQLGYRNMMIMSAGYPAWEKAGYPTEKSGH
jgi:rhodanese-related sulfurtransferase